LALLHILERASLKLYVRLAAEIGKSSGPRSGEMTFVACSTDRDHSSMVGENKEGREQGHDARLYTTGEMVSTPPRGVRHLRLYISRPPWEFRKLHAECPPTKGEGDARRLRERGGKLSTPWK
jgi:hypothetical protein